MSNAEVIEPAVGTIIDNKYRIDCMIGQGGMGRVFRVTHVHLNKVFALKLMSVSDGKRLSRFKREAEALAKINHPNVVMVTDYGVTPDNAPYIVMDYIEGMTLRKYLKTKGSLTEKEAIHIGKQISAGLHEAHANSITHRDLKPDNIMVQWLSDGDSIVRVVDFGLAKLNEPAGNSNITEDREMPGTIRYMAPEQLCRLKVDHRTDIFSFCLIMYEMLTGTVPHVVVSKAKPINEIRPDISARFSQIILKGLAQDANERQQNVLDIKREMETLEHGQVLRRTDPLPPIPGGDDRSSPSNLSNPNLTASGTHVTKIQQENTFPSNASGTMNSLTSEVNAAPTSRRNLIITVAALVLIIGGAIGWQVYKEVSGKLARLEKTEEKLPESALPKLIPVIGGKFRMGDDKGDPYARPAHDVVVAPFQVSKYLITNRQFGEFVKRANYKPPKSWSGNNPPTDVMEKPVTDVSVADAQAYCVWLTTQSGQTYRLLTEEEWEFLARKRADYAIEEMLGNYTEWTDTKFYIYPGSNTKMPPTKRTLYVFRGKGDSKEAVENDPVTFRSWQVGDYVYPGLSFRVAANSAK